MSASMDRYIIAGGLAVSASGQTPANLVIEDGRITEWVGDPGGSDLPVFDAGGHIMLPGLIDAHTHFHMAGGDTFTVDDFAYGGRLAASAGVTSVIDFIEPAPAGDLAEAIETRFRDVAGCPVDYQFHLVIPKRFAGRPDWPELIDRYGLAAVKGFTTYREDGLCLDEEDLRHLLAWALRQAGPLTVHAEDDGLLERVKNELGRAERRDMSFFPQSRPAETEQLAVRKLLVLAGAAPVYFVHISTEKALANTMAARLSRPERPLWVETCPQYLVLDQSLYGQEAALYTVCPPLRTPEDQKALWAGIRSGSVDVVASDHCAYTPEMKTGSTWQETRPGLPAVDAILPVLVNEGVRQGRIGWEDLVRVTAENPARIFRLNGKGSLTPGSDADLVLISRSELAITEGSVFPAGEPAMPSRAGYAPFTARHLRRPWLRHVIRRGEFLVRAGKVQDGLGQGSFIHC